MSSGMSIRDAAYRAQRQLEKAVARARVVDEIAAFVREVKGDQPHRTELRLVASGR